MIDIIKIIIKENITSLKFEVKRLKNFGIIFFVIFLLMSIYSYFKINLLFSSLFLIIGAIFITLGLWFPTLLKPIYKLWMTFAFIIGTIVNTLLLSIFFLIFFTPFAIISRIFKRDLLDERIDKSATSYWKEYKVNKDITRYEKGF